MFLLISIHELSQSAVLQILHYEDGTIVQRTPCFIIKLREGFQLIWAGFYGNDLDNMSCPFQPLSSWLVRPPNRSDS